MNNLELHFDPHNMQIVITNDGMEVGRLPIGIAYWLQSALTHDGFLKVKDTKEPVKLDTKDL